MILFLKGARFTIPAFSTPKYFRGIMKTIVSVFALMMMSFSGIMAQRTSTQTVGKPKVLIDYRLGQKSTTLSIPPATQKMVLSKVFRSYLTDESKCSRNFEPSGNDWLKSARDAGQFAPGIVDMATGSFTAPNRTETAYVISVNECNASHADAYGSKRVAIFAGQELMADVDANFKSSVVRNTDLDGDGINELLMGSSDMSQGTLTEMAALVEFRNGRLRVIDDLGTVSEDSCASELPGSTSRASVVSIPPAAPGTMPKLKMDNYQSGCRKGSRWRYVSSGKLE